MTHCTFRPYLPGIPTSEPYLRQAWKIADMLERSSEVYVGAAEYGLLVGEVIAECNTPPGTLPKSLKFGGNPCAHFINAGTDDAAEVARRNRETPGAKEFQAKMSMLVSKRLADAIGERRELERNSAA